MTRLHSDLFTVFLSSLGTGFGLQRGLWIVSYLALYGIMFSPTLKQLFFVFWDGTFLESEFGQICFVDVNCNMVNNLPGGPMLMSLVCKFK